MIPNVPFTVMPQATLDYYNDYVIINSRNQQFTRMFYFTLNGKQYNKIYSIFKAHLLPLFVVFNFL